MSKVSTTLCADSLQSLILLLDQCSVCPGHPDAQFIWMVEAKKGKLMSKDGKSIAATIDDFSTVYLNSDEYSKTVRASTCEMLVYGSKCPSCVSYRDCLRRIYHRWLKQKSPSPCELVGFTNLGDINSQLDRVQEQCESEQNSHGHANVASHMLLFMVRGMFTSLEFPYAHFETRGATADTLYPLI